MLMLPGENVQTCFVQVSGVFTSWITPSFYAGRDTVLGSEGNGEWS